MEIIDLTAHELAEKLEKNEVTSEEIVKCYYEKIKTDDPKIKAYLSLLEKEAIMQAQKIDEDRKNGKSVGKYAGIPFALKDNICKRDTKTTCGSKILENFVSPYDATVVEKINGQGLICLGKTNMDEFAMGSSTENSAYQITHNPYDLERVPGGSSGGSAAAVAGKLAPWAIGSDTGGSVRQPASLCGLVGLKPTYGLISRYGLVAYASSFDQVGPLTKDVTDCAILMNIITGYDEKDSTSVNIPKKDYTKFLLNDVKGMKIGLPKEYLEDGIDHEVKQAILDVAKKYEEMGAIVEECSFNVGKYALGSYYIIVDAEASSNLGRFDGIRYGHRTEKISDIKDIYKNSRSEGFGEEVKRRIMLGTYVLSAGFYDAYYKKAQKVRTVLRNAYNELFEKYDLLISPTAPTTAFKIGENTNDPMQMYLEDIYTVPINMAGIPAMNVPCGKDSKGLPIGFQLIGKAFDEEKIFRAAFTYEQNKF